MIDGRPPQATERDRCLDGLRGWGALFVLLYHVFSDGFPATDWAKSDLNRWLPFNGLLAVSVFFVVSGMALSSGFVRFGDRMILWRLAIGRYVRLFIPIAVVSAIVHLLLVTHLILPPGERRPLVFASLLTFVSTPEHLVRFCTYEVFFAYERARTYAGPLWTIPIEAVGSLLVLGLLALVGRNWWRWGCYALIVPAVLAVNGIYILFIAGIILAELSTLPSLRGPMWQVAAWLAVVQGVVMPFLNGVEHNTIQFTSTILLCWGLLTATPARAFLSTSFSSWLGRLSFPLYLVHGPIMFVIGVPLYLQVEGSVSGIVAMGCVVTLISIVGAIPFIHVNEAAIRSGRYVSRWFLPGISRYPQS